MIPGRIFRGFVVDFGWFGAILGGVRGFFWSEAQFLGKRGVFLVHSRVLSFTFFARIHSKKGQTGLWIMRFVEREQRVIDSIAVEDIKISLKSRDETPKVLLALQALHGDETSRARIFQLFEEHFQTDVRRDTGRPGMDYWSIFVMLVLKQGCDVGFDHLEDVANNDRRVRQMVGRGGWTFEDEDYSRQTIIDNVNAVSDVLLDKLNQVIVEFGHRLIGRRLGDKLMCRMDSMVVLTGVRFPTDIGLLRDSARCLIRCCQRAAKAHKAGGWREYRGWERENKRTYRSASQRRPSRTAKRQAVRPFLRKCRALAKRVAALLEALPEDAHEMREQIEYYLSFLLLFIDQVTRRILKGEKIPHSEKVFSIHKLFTRWINKGKVGILAELGVPVAVIEDQHQFVLHHKIGWTGTDIDLALPMIDETQARFEDVKACTFDRGFHSKANQIGANERLEHNGMNVKGRKSQAIIDRDNQPENKAALQQHSRIEACLRNLEICGLDVVRSKHKDGFARTVAMAIVGANAKRIGQILQKRRRKTRRRKRAA